MTASFEILHEREACLARLRDLKSTGENDHFFLTSDWALNYLARWPSGDFFKAMVLNHGDLTSGQPATGVVCLSQGVRSSPFSRRHRSLGFNESSSRELSEVTAEVNGLIGSPPVPFERCIPDILDQLDHIGDWDELRLPALSARETCVLRQAAAARGFITHTLKNTDTYWIDLRQIAEQHGGDYLSSRTSNTRRQLRRALRDLERTIGRFEIASALDVAQAHEWLDGLGALHIKRWSSRNIKSGFENPHFACFHRQLICKMLDAGNIEILRFSAGGHVIAYIYNFVRDGRVYFSMSGIDYDRFAAFKPGLLSHWKSIELYQSRGFHTYDFQAGTARYKQSLCTHVAPQTTIILRRPLLKFRLEAAGRWLKRKLNRQEDKSHDYGAQGDVRLAVEV